ncbi:MAG: adenylosuccinate lyase [Oligoflexus sp.]
MADQSLFAISVVDGRYRSKVESLGPILSEAGLIERRLKVELAWLLHLAEHPQIGQDLQFSATQKECLEAWLCDVPRDAAVKIKDIEQTTNHDVKAVEYYIRDLLKQSGADDQQLAFIHFACTSEDINNLAYALMLQDAREVLAQEMAQILKQVSAKASTYADLPMLSRTHGQTASPTSLGKELAVFGHRLAKVYQRLVSLPIEGKINGAVGNYNAHVVAYPEVDWPHLAASFIETRLGLTQNPLTTQIENHDSMVEIVETIRRFNTILLGFSRDLWSYISINYFKLAVKEGEVGSSTMPHKVNPIDFENCEGNLGVANSLAAHFSDKLPISRWQRDLSDSTVQRVLGTFFAHTMIAYKAFSKGFDKISAHEPAIAKDLSTAWEVLGEAIQTVMRRHGVMDAYERLKAATRGQAVSQEALTKLLQETPELPEQVKDQLAKLQPSSYIGLAKELALKTTQEIDHALR